MLAFSTCWNNARHIDGEDVIDEILELGFDHIELSHGMTISRLPGIQRAYEEKKFTCSGVHNYFPAPLEVMIDAPDAYEFTSKHAYDRKRVMDLTNKTLEVAAQFDAKYVVLHMGSVPMNRKRWTRKLTDLAEQELREGKKFLRIKEKFIKKRAKINGPYFERAQQALEILSEKAKEFGVPLAVESRSRYEDVPSEPEMRLLMEQFKDNPWVGYWHDFGHVQLKHNLTLLEHSSWLEEMSPYLIGCHLHDVHYPARDHRVPLTGELDYDDLLRHVAPEKPLVWELSPSQKRETILDALKLWKEKYPEYC